MDRIADSGSADVGSNPSGYTKWGNTKFWSVVPFLFSERIRLIENPQDYEDSSARFYILDKKGAVSITTYLVCRILI